MTRVSHGRFPHSLPAVTAAVVVLGLFGCRGLGDAVTDVRLNLRAERAALAGWHRRADCHDDLGHPPAFKHGFKDGYLDAAHGGEGTAPAVPPKCYWGCHADACERTETVNAYYRGFARGFMAAGRDGVAGMSQVPFRCPCEPYQNLGGTYCPPPTTFDERPLPPPVFTPPPAPRPERERRAADMYGRPVGPRTDAAEEEEGGPEAPYEPDAGPTRSGRDAGPFGDFFPPDAEPSDAPRPDVLIDTPDIDWFDGGGGSEPPTIPGSSSAVPAPATPVPPAPGAADRTRQEPVEAQRPRTSPPSR